MRSPLWTAKYTALLKLLRSPLALVSATLLLIWCVGIFGRGYWTPDEPREADIAWRMSWQADKAVPLLAGEAFCEKPPLTYWLAAAPIRAFRHRSLGRAPAQSVVRPDHRARRRLAGATQRRTASRAWSPQPPSAPSCSRTRSPSGLRPMRPCSPRCRSRCWARTGDFMRRTRRERLRGYSCDALRPWVWAFSARAPPPGWCRRWPS